MISAIRNFIFNYFGITDQRHHVPRRANPELELIKQDPRLLATIENQTIDLAVAALRKDLGVVDFVEARLKSLAMNAKTKDPLVAEFRALLEAANAQNSLQKEEALSVCDWTDRLKANPYLLCSVPPYIATILNNMESPEWEKNFNELRTTVLDINKKLAEGFTKV